MPENGREFLTRSRVKTTGTFSQVVAGTMDTWAAIPALALSPESIAALRTGRLPNWTIPELGDSRTGQLKRWQLGIKKDATSDVAACFFDTQIRRRTYTTSSVEPSTQI